MTMDQSLIEHQCHRAKTYHHVERVSVVLVARDSGGRLTTQQISILARELSVKDLVLAVWKKRHDRYSSEGYGFE